MFVYVIGAPRTSKKIGIAADPSRRLQALQSGNSKVVSVLHSRKVDSSVAAMIETHVHWMLKDYREAGEWFRVSLEQAIAAIDASIAADGNWVKAKRSVGRKKEFPNRITLPLSDEMLAGIDAVREGDEDRLKVIRAAIERELKRREKAKKTSAD